MISRKPSFSSPSRFSAGTSTSVKESSPVSEECQPSFSSFAATSYPGISLSRTRNESPWWPPSWVVLQAQTRKSARTPLVMKVLAPLTT